MSQTNLLREPEKYKPISVNMSTELDKIYRAKAESLLMSKAELVQLVLLEGIKREEVFEKVSQ